MAAAETVVKRIEIRATSAGLDQARSQADSLEGSLNAVAAANEKLAAAFAQSAAANDNFIQAQEKVNKTWTQGARDLLTWLDVWERLKSSVKGGEDTFHSVATAVGGANLALRAMGVAFAPLILLSRTLFAVGAGIEILQRAASDFEKMVATGERAEKLDVGASFVQGFEKIAVAARLSEAAMAKALDNAALFVRDTFGETNKLVQLLSDIEDKIGGSRLSASKALELPTNTEERLKIAADAMRELESRGERLAALKIAESMGLGELAEKLRAGQMSMAELADAVERIKSDGGLDAAAQQALELSRAIEQTKQEIDDAVSVSFNLSSIHEGILNVWLSILTVVRNVVQAFNDGVAYLASWGVELGKVYTFISKTLPILSAITSAKNLLTGGDQPLTVDVNKTRIGARSIANPVVLPDTAAKAAKAASAAADEWDQMVKRIEDSTRKMAEQAATYGKGAEEAARYRAEQELLTAAERSGRERTAELVAQVKDLSDKAGQAAANLARTKVTSDIGFDRNTALLSDSERGIAEKLRPLYGDDVQQSLDSAEAGQIRINNALKYFTKLASDGMSGFITDLSHGVKAADALASAMKRVGDSLISSGIQGALSGISRGDYIQAAIGGATAAAGFIVNATGPSEKSKQRKQQMMDDWAKAQQDDFDAIQAQQEAVIQAGIAAAKAAEKAAEDATKKAEAATRRIEGLQDRAFFAGIDTSTLSGQLEVFDRQAQRAREEEVRQGGEALAALEEALYAERARVVQDYLEDIIAQEKRRFDEAREFLNQFARTIHAFIAGLKAGAESPLSPGDRLTAAQTEFNQQLALARSGDRNALSGITGNASAVLDAARAMYASSENYQAIFRDITAQLETLPEQVSPEQLVVNAISDQTNTLASILNEIDANGDGLISRQEASNTFLSSIFNEIDTNGDNQLDRLELIKFATQGTESGTGEVAGYTNTSADLLASQQSILDSIATNTNQLATIQQQLQTIYNTTAKTSNNAARTATNTMYSANTDTQSAAGLAGDFTYARGGWVDGSGTGTSDSISARLSDGEYVVRASQAQIYGPLLEWINRGTGRAPIDGTANDNVSQEIAGLRQQVEVLTRVIANGHDRVASEVQSVRGAVADGNMDRKKGQRGAPGTVAGRGASVAA